MTTAGLAAYQTWATTALANKPRYSVVIPAYNEAWRVVPTIGAIATYMSGLGQPWELIVADDGSTDDTAALVADLGLVNLHLLTGTPNQGKGAAVRRGMLAARGDVILFADADQSTPIEQFEDLLDQINKGSDVVVGSRAADGAEVENKSAVRHLMSSGLKFLVTTGFRLPVADTQCGFKLFTAEAAKLLFSRQLIDDFSFDLEVLFLAKKFGLVISEVPVTWIDAPGSKVDAAKVAAKFLTDLVGIRLNDFQGRYARDNHQPAKADQIVDALTPGDTEQAADQPGSSPRADVRSSSAAPNAYNQAEQADRVVDSKHEVSL